MALLNPLFSQEFEGVYVEKYHTVTETEAKLDSNLVAGAICYRIYVDLGENTALQAIYGDRNHPFFVKTTTHFYNSDKGAATGDRINNYAFDIHPEVAWDSWITLGLGSVVHWGIPLDEDQDGSVLQKSGLEEQDGMKYASKYMPCTPYQIELQELISGQSSSFEMHDGCLAVMGEVYGVDSKNRVLVAQLTTDGILSFEMNVQIRDKDGFVDKVVAKNPVAGEKADKSLTYNSADGIR